AKYVTRINAIYAFTKDKDKSDPYKYLKDEVSNITGQEIHYFTTVQFESFTQIIDEFGGIEVCPEDSFTAQYPNDYPKAGESQWLYYQFSEGCQTVMGEKALVYARFRYVSRGPSSLASDFSRARRQQEVIEALKDRALAQDMSITVRASTYWKLIQNFMDNIDTNIGFEDVLAGLSHLDKASKDPLKV
ncbi:MAG TPA: LCP family protein, partial [Candidatus Dojkabacteria bacterium]|nr:LCP family protein [Candidatus Dojkabacteria bacterium]